MEGHVILSKTSWLYSYTFVHTHYADTKVVNNCNGHDCKKNSFETNSWRLDWPEVLYLSSVDRSAAYRQLRWRRVPVLDTCPHWLQTFVRNQVQSFIQSERHWSRNRSTQDGWWSARGGRMYSDHNDVHNFCLLWCCCPNNVFNRYIFYGYSDRQNRL